MFGSFIRKTQFVLNNLITAQLIYIVIVLATNIFTVLYVSIRPRVDSQSLQL